MLQVLRFSLADMLHDRSRTLLSITGLAVVVASYFILFASGRTFSSYLNVTTVSRNLIVIQNDMIDPSVALLEPQVIQAAQDLIPATIRRISPIVFRHTRVGEHLVQLCATAVQDWEPVYHLVLLKGAWSGKGREIVVSEGIALANAWQVGSTVQIFGSSFSISGIFRSPGTAFASVWMPIETFRALFDTQRGYQALFVQPAVGVDPDTVRLRLQNDPRLADGYAVYFEDNYTRRKFQTLKDLSSMMTVMSGVALLGIVFGIFNAATLSTVERGRELGILLGIGFSHRTVRRLMLVRSILQGLLAYGVGLAAADLFFISQQAFAPLVILGLPFSLKITPGMAASGLAWVVALALLGAWLSTRTLFKLRVVALLSKS
jgi:ABC-type antimicrobial peptide transport system permease subunit